MYARQRRRISIIRDYSIGWTLGFFILLTLQGISTGELERYGVEVWQGWLVVMVLGPVVGALSGYIQHIWEERYYKRMSLPKLMGIKFLFSLFFLIVLILLVYTMDVLVFRVRQMSFIEFISQRQSVAFYLFVFIMDVVLVSVRQVNVLLGPGNLRRFIRGNFYYPKEEERIFMFIDLRSSTETAETLGHLKYSMLIQDCFEDLAVVNEYYAEIYQYVGDEVVLTWPMRLGLNNSNCIRAYFAFHDQLLSRSAHYQEQYGRVPFFKAGVNGGKVIVAEVGKYKREIAYHGDTINTAARIQGKCNDFGEEILVSETLMQMLLPAPDFTFSHLGKIHLKGKRDDVVIYAASKEEIKSEDQAISAQKKASALES